MMHFFQRAIFFAVLLASTVLARAGVSYDESPVFAFDTRDYTTGLAAESAVFAFDTRVVDGLNGNAVSNVFSFDTQLYGLVSLSLAGPSAMAPGGIAQFTCVATYSGGQPKDITTAAQWSLLPGAPTGVTLGSNGIVQVSSTVKSGSFTLHASYQTPTGQRFAEGTVTVGSAFVVRASQQVLANGGGAYTVNLHASATGGSGTVTYRWDTNNDGVYGDLVGPDVAWNLTSLGGRYDVRVEATDASGQHAYATQSILIDKVSVANQPAKLAPVSTVGGSYFLDATGQAFQFDSSRVGNGLIVITHDLKESGGEQWARNLAVAIEQRLPAGSKPNIFIYDWGADSDPTRINIAGLNATSIATSAETDPILRAGKWLAKKYGTRTLKKFLEGLDDVLTVADDTATILDFSTGPYIAAQHGLVLYNRLLTESQASTPRVDFTKPIHFIGKGVGGNLVAQAALSLKWAGKDVDLVTMLDTVMPDPVFYKGLPNPTVVEHITSSYKGDMEWPQTWLVPSGTYLRRSNIMDSLQEYFGVVFLDILGQLPVLGGLAQDLAGMPSAHDLAPYWYRNTVIPNTGLQTSGFYNSPFIAGLRVPHSLSSFSAAAARTQQAAPPPSYLSGFSTFGTVANAGGVYTVTESADAGIFAHITIPVDVEKLQFKFRFTGTADGDCLTVRFGARSEIFTTGDLSAVHGTFVTAEVSLGKYAGMTDDLVFTLVSRGQSGEVLEIKEIEIVQNDDVDGDGLTTAQELALGANPQSPDTDGDGLDDWYEVNVSHTNPTRADSDGDGQSDAAEIAAGTDPMDSRSIFAVTEFYPVGSGFLLRWIAVTGKTYRIVRSPTADFAAFDVIASGLAGVVPTRTYTDTTINTVTTPRAFYRIEVE